MICIFPFFSSMKFLPVKKPVDKRAAGTAGGICTNIDQLKRAAGYEELMNLIRQRVAAGDENWKKETAPAADSIVCKPKCKKKTEDGVFGEMCAFPDDRLIDCDEPHQFSIGGLFPFCRIIDIENEPCHKLRCLCAVIGRLRRKQEDNYRKSDRRQKESKAHRKIVAAYLLPAVLISDIKKHSLPLITRTFI